MARARSLAHLVRHRAGLRLLLACLAGGTTVLVLATLGEDWPLRLVAGWDAFALALLSLAWAVIWNEGSAQTRARAAGEDPGRRMVWVFTLLASSASLFAAVVVLRQAHHLAPGRAAWWLALCVTAVGSAWLLTHTSWALRYAHLYYRGDREGVGGLDFPGGRDPDQLDFAYFAFTVGMCFQTSDVTVASPQIRRAVLFHAIQSFAFTSAILALVLNLVVGFVG